jgi:hypothetical protein
MDRDDAQRRSIVIISEPARDLVSDATKELRENLARLGADARAPGGARADTRSSDYA